MDGLDFFRKLGAGAKFNFRRFKSDAERLEILKPRNQLALTSGGQKRSLEDITQVTPSKRAKEEDDGYAISGDVDADQPLQLLGSINAASQQVAENLPTSRKKKKKKALDEAKLAELKTEEIRHLRNQHHIHVYGSDMPDPARSFDELRRRYAISKQLIANVEKMGFTAPTPIQMQAIPAMLERREILGCAPTGSGKTLAFLLPLLHHLKCPMRKGFRALILAPTRELARQIHRECQRLAEGTGFRIVFIEKSSTAVEKYGPKTAQKFDVLVTTPNRLVYLIKDDPPLISLANVEWLVVDESDKLFEDGTSGFRQQLGSIYQACSSNNVCRALFSATFAYEVEQWCKLNLNNVLQVDIGARNSATHTVEQSLEYVGTEAGKLLALRNLIHKGIQPPVLIFVQSKDRAKELFHEIIYDGINVDVIHADRTQAQRDKVVEGFRAGSIWVLICTELMGRGIDFKGVNLVINYDFPNSAISYIHKIGRTGRAGRRGQAVTYFTDEDKTNLKSIANVLRGAGCPVPDYMLKLHAPSRKEKKKLARKVPDRKPVRTLPRERQKKKHKKPKDVKQNADGGKGLKENKHRKLVVDKREGMKKSDDSKKATSSAKLKKAQKKKQKQAHSQTSKTKRKPPKES